MTILAEQIDSVKVSGIVEQIDSSIQSLTALRDEWLSHLINAFEHEGTRLVRTPKSYLTRGMRPGDTGHMVEQIESDTGYQRFYIMQPGEAGYEAWCRGPVGGEPRVMRDNAALGHIYRGEHRLLGFVDGEAVLAPNEAASAAEEVESK